MKREQFNKIYTELEQYPDFKGDYNEWYSTLIDYSYDGILKNLQKHRSTNAPIARQLIGKLEKEETIEDWITECDYCKQRFTIKDNNMTEYEKHRRKCSKIDFIDRMCMRYKHDHIPIVEYYQMSDEELNQRYRKIMDYYLSQPREEIIKKI